MESKSTKYFNKVTITFAKNYQEVFEARDFLEDELFKFLKNIQDTPELKELRKWKWGTECGASDSDNEFETYEDFVKNKPYFIDNQSRVYLFQYDNKENYYAHFGFGFDLKNNGGQMVFFTSIAALEGSETELKNMKAFTPQTLQNGLYIRYDGNISIEEITLEKAIGKVKILIKAWDGFLNRKKIK